MATITKEAIEKLQMGDESALQKSTPEPMDFPVAEEFNTPYTLHYKAVHNIGSQNFMGPASKEAAIKLGNIYCSHRNWRFIQVRPMFIDILSTPQTEEERAKFKDKN